MTFDLWPTTQELLEVFSDEMAQTGGSVSDTYDDGRRLFVRAVLPAPVEVAPGDRHQGGVAMHATEQEVRVHPYIFRQVCRNGAISAQAIETRVVRRADGDFDVASIVRQAVRECCADEVFARGVDELRSARETEADVILNLMPLLSHLPGGQGGHFVREIMARFVGGTDRSGFGLVNAVTATARDTRDPEERWRLEELGGGLAARISRADRPRAGGAALREPLDAEAMSVA